MAGVAFWRDSGNPIASEVVSSNPWDTVTVLARNSSGSLVSKQFPGLCEIKGIAQLQIDTKHKPGDDGSAITVTGYQPGPFEIECKVWTPEQWDALQEIVDLIWRTPNKKSRLATLAFDISSPALDMLKISSAVVMGVSLPERAGEDGARVVRFKCQESVKRSAKNNVKTVKPGPSVVPQLRRDAPNNQTPAKPSTQNFSPSGANFTPASGPF